MKSNQYRHITAIAKSTGFNMIELLITMVVAAFLVGIAAPSFQTLLGNNRVTKVTNEYTTAFRLARSTALSRGVVTFVCSSDNANSATPTCNAGGNWSNGLLVFSKPANAIVTSAGSFAAGDTLHYQSNFGGRTADEVTTNPVAAPGFIGFQSDGFVWQVVPGTTVTPALIICDRERQEERGKVYNFSLSGRMTITDTTATSTPGC